MIVFAVLYLLALGLLAGQLAPSPHRASGPLLSVPLACLLVSGIVLAAGAL